MTIPNWRIEISRPADFSRSKTHHGVVTLAMYREVQGTIPYHIYLPLDHAYLGSTTWECFMSRRYIPLYPLCFSAPTALSAKAHSTWMIEMRQRRVAVNQTKLLLRMPQLYQIFLCLLPLLPSLWVLLHLLSADVNSAPSSASNAAAAPSTGAQLLLFTALGSLGYFMTNRLIPNIKSYMIKRGICGKDLGKKGSKNEDVDV